VQIPEQIGANGVQAHRLGHLQTVTPVFPRDARCVDFATANLKRLAIEQKIVRADDESVTVGPRGSGIGPCGRRSHRQQASQGRKSPYAFCVHSLAFCRLLRQCLGPGNTAANKPDPRHELPADDHRLAARNYFQFGNISTSLLFQPVKHVADSRVHGGHIRGGRT
jgi:hypothetical protein